MWRSSYVLAAYHQTNATHPLAQTFPEIAPRLNLPHVGVGGDSDTIQAASDALGQRSNFDIISLSVYRQTVDLTEIERASYVIPGGSCRLPGTVRFADQLELWRTHQRIPMHVDESATTRSRSM